MFIRNRQRLVAFATFTVLALAPTTSLAQEATAQDPTAVLQEVRKGFGKEFPHAVRLTVAGSGYKPGTGDARTHYRIEPYTWEIDASSPQALGTPIGFLAAAMAAKPTLTTETLFGTTYKVIAFTAPNGQPVRGYISDQNVLDRIRSERVDDTGKVPIEAVFMAWQDFGGVRFPSLMIQKANDQVQRILVVSNLEAGGTGPATTQPPAAPAPKS